MRVSRTQFLRFLLGAFLSLPFNPVRALADMVPRVFKSRGETLPVTPTEEFYVEDYSGPPESLKRGLRGWRLDVKGRIDRPLALDYERILSRPPAKRTVTINCIGNPVGGHAIGNAEWEGILLKDLLREAAPHFLANALILRAEDGYEDSVPLKSGFHPGALLAYKMNGQPLTLDHGFPLRLIAPGLYGIKQVKWIREVEVVRGAPPGYWQKRGWSKQARAKIFSRIDSPRDGERLSGRTALIRGVAFAGDRGVQYVEVSTDGEQTWSLARLMPPLSPYSWVLWSFPCVFPKPGAYRVAVRAADQYDGRQADDLREPFPSGTSGIHRIEVHAA